MTDEIPAATPLPEALADHPPSAELVYRLVARHEPVTLATLEAHSHRPGRTLRFALERLLEADLVVKRPNVRDARQYLFETTATPSTREAIDHE